jgi:hypothetical protein
MHYALKYTKTQSLFKTLEWLRLLCHPTCFGHILDHLQGMFLVQCCFPSCFFVTILLGYTSLLSVLLCTVHNKNHHREVYMTTTQIEDTATYPSKIVTKKQDGK